MIISASRRTDIPAFYPDWLLNRLKEGFALVPNPYNPGLVRRVTLERDTIDCLVLWTKNPLPMMARLDDLDVFKIPYLFQFTLTPYGRDIEPGLPQKERLIEAFISLGQRLGPRRVIWRYDPVLINGVYTHEAHARAFAQTCARLAGYTRRCVISFIDLYRGMTREARDLVGAEPAEEDIRRIAQAFSRAAARHGIALFTCCEKADLGAYGIEHASCVDGALIDELFGTSFSRLRDKNQRPGCRCAPSVDIGMYDSCPAGCVYCYANRGAARAQKRHAAHDPLSPMLIGQPPPGAVDSRQGLL